MSEKTKMELRGRKTEGGGEATEGPMELERHDYVPTLGGSTEEAKTEEKKATRETEMDLVMKALMNINKKMDENGRKMEENTKDINIKLEENCRKLEENKEELSKQMESMVEKFKRENQERVKQLEGKVNENRIQINRVEKLMEEGIRSNLDVSEAENYKTRLEFKKDVKELTDKVENRFKIMESSVSEDITEIGLQVGEIKTTLENEIEKNRTGNKSDITRDIYKEEIKKLRKELEDKMKTISNGSGQTVVKTIIGCQSDSSPKFEGDIKRLHPQIFLKILRNRIRNIAVFDDVREIIRNSLTGQAQTWYNSKEGKINSFYEFENLFLKNYWGENNQGLVRERLYFGKYDYSRSTSLSNYALGIYSQAQFFEPPIEEEEIVVFISRHFKWELSEAIALNNIRTFDALTSYLDRVDRSNTSRRDTNLQQSELPNRNPHLRSNQSNNYNNRNYYQNYRQNQYSSNYPAQQNVHQSNQLNRHNNFSNRPNLNNNRDFNQTRDNHAYNDLIEGRNRRRNSLDNLRRNQNPRENNRQVNFGRRSRSVGRDNNGEVRNNDAEPNRVNTRDESHIRGENDPVDPNF